MQYLIHSLWLVTCLGENKDGQPMARAVRVAAEMREDAREMASTYFERCDFANILATDVERECSSVLVPDY